MKKKLIISAVAATTISLAAAGSASAAGSKEGGACARAGVAVVRSGALGVTARDIAKEGLLGLNLGQVVKLHTQSPELFAGGPDSIGDWC